MNLPALISWVTWATVAPVPLRKLLNLSLKSDSEDKLHGCEAVDSKLIAQIHPDGNITEREDNVVEARTTENRYLYRELKKVYADKNRKPDVNVQLKEDLTKKVKDD